MTNDTVMKGDYALIYLKPGKTWLIKVDGDSDIHTHAGYINGNEILNKEYGSNVTSNTGREFVILRPTMADFLMKSSRPTQIVYPKDLGAIAVWVDFSPGKVVVEAGTGSGTITCLAANLVRPGGHVYSYEIRDDFVKAAMKNISKTGLSDYISLIHKDAREGIDQKNADIAIVDVGDPWTLIEPMKNSLRGAGMLVSISPTINQVEKVTIELVRQGFVEIESIELMLRRMEAREGKSRPSMRMIGHTAYLTFARKVLDKS